MMILVIRIFPRATGIVALGGSSKDFGGQRSFLGLGEQKLGRQPWVPGFSEIFVKKIKKK
jgi:hypothetical protein